MPADLRWITDLQQVAAQLYEGKKVDVEKLKVDLFGDRIFVYSPKGDIYDLPDGSYPLDFAYRVHSDIGQHAAGFIINGKMEPFDYKLKYGDVIEVITNKNAKPKARWREMIFTGHARAKIRAQINKLRS